VEEEQAYEEAEPGLRLYVLPGRAG